MTPPPSALIFPHPAIQQMDIFTSRGTPIPVAGLLMTFASRYRLSLHARPTFLCFLPLGFCVPRTVHIGFFPLLIAHNMARLTLS